VPRKKWVPQGRRAWVPETERFGARLALIRQQMGWNLQEAAIECHLPAQSWRDWEKHGKTPRDYEGTCKTIATRTECDLVWLLTGKSAEAVS
jgi:transcriptional regulator with XRE-family HTH domain